MKKKTMKWRLLTIESAGSVIETRSEKEKSDKENEEEKCERMRRKYVNIFNIYSVISLKILSNCDQCVCDYCDASLQCSAYPQILKFGKKSAVFF